MGLTLDGFFGWGRRVPKAVPPLSVSSFFGQRVPWPQRKLATFLSQQAQGVVGVMLRQRECCIEEAKVLRYCADRSPSGPWHLTTMSAHTSESL